MVEVYLKYIEVYSMIGFGDPLRRSKYNCLFGDLDGFMIRSIHMKYNAMTH